MTVTLEASPTPGGEEYRKNIQSEVSTITRSSPFIVNALKEE